VVFGKSGGGKSYTVKLEILRSLIFGTQVLIIDPENEYKYLAETVGGTSIKISITSEQHINPFDLPSVRPDESPADVFKSHILDLTGLFHLILGDLTPEESSVLDEALIQTYAVKDITPDSDFSNASPPVLSDLQNIIEGLTGGESLAIRLKKYTSGTFAGFLNMPTNVSLDNNLIVFSIRDLEEELRPIAMYSILNYIWASIRKTLKKRLLIVDEAWWLMKYDIGADFLYNIAKRGRKYYVGLTTISQDVPDFLSSPKGKAIITNSSMQILMKQSPAAIDIIQQTFNLTDSEKFYLLEASVGFGLFFLGNSHIGIQVVPSYSEDQIITSDPKQILEIEKAKEDWAKLRS
jgi:type IV secretory pathway VirB4 component